MRIVIEIVDHKEQRYPTVGDWYFDDGGIVIRISKLGDFYKEVCVAIHELVEIVLCMKHGISQHDVDTFDKKFEELRIEGNVDEPGDDINAPYRKEHCFATGIERLLIAELGIDWKIYEDVVNSL